MGDGARRRLQLMAHTFENKLNTRKNGAGGQGQGGRLPENSSSAAERRGLLDGDDDDGMEQIEFEMHNKKDM